MRDNSSENNICATRRKKHQRTSLLIKIQLVILGSLLIVILGMVGWLMLANSAENDFQNLSQHVQERVEMTAPTVRETQSLELPAERPAAETKPKQTEVPAITKETEPSIKTPLLKYSELYAKNQEMVGWLCIEGTKVDYPVMHTPDDPEKYLHANFEGGYSYPGVPFLDAKCTLDSDNLLIYGHNMPNGSMFRSLMNYQQKDYWQNHPTIRFDTLYEEQEYEVMAAFYDRVYYTTETCFKFYQFINAEDEADFDNAASQFKGKSIYDTGVEAEYGDQLITLVTCAYHTDNGRFVVVARRK